MRRLIVITLFLCIPVPVFALSSEIHISKDGKAVMNGVKISQIAGQTFFARLYWGDAFVRITVKTNDKTDFYRATGEITNISEVAVDDILNLEGELELGGNALVIIPKSVKNTSVEKERSTLSGKVISVDIPQSKFVLESKSKGTVTVTIGTTTEFIKGNRKIDLSRIKIGDTITKISGDYDYKIKTLSALSVIVYIDLSIYKPKVHVGIVDTIKGTSLPTDILIKVGKNVYVVYLNNDTNVINKNRKKTTLSRFESGDKIRLYGTIREIDERIIDAEVIRNMDL